VTPVVRDDIHIPTDERHSVIVPGEQLILGRFRVNTKGNDDVIGEGTSSVCRKGVNVQTGERVAIKMFKNKIQEGMGSHSVKLTKFRRQIQVLKELQEPWRDNIDPRLMHPLLAKANAADLFVRLIDYSRDVSGLPGPDPKDGVMYAVTELAEYSLKDYIKRRRERQKTLSVDVVRGMAQAIILCTAGLHAHGLVHLDLKPENLMFFEGKLKIIDLDGCVKVNSLVSIEDSSLSFSPCYCSPEWAVFLTDDADDPCMKITCGLDVWSVGMTIVELVTLDAILKPTYASFLKNGRSHRQAGFLFMEWLGDLKKVDVPSTVAELDPDLYNLLTEWILVCSPERRKTLAECLGHSIFSAPRRSVPPSVMSIGSDAIFNEERKYRRQDTSEQATLHGLLWKLNAGADANDASKWLQRDMWISTNASLCYFSQKERRRLVLLDQSEFAVATIKPFEGGAKPNAFQIEVGQDQDEKEVVILACSDAPDRKIWLEALQRLTNVMMPTMVLNAALIKELKQHKLSIKNRRMNVQELSQGLKGNFKAAHRSILWKLKSNGDSMNDDHWFERDMWIANNGSLCYYSKKEKKELVYYTGEDVARASISATPAGAAVKPHAFQVHLAPVDDLEFLPGEFAAPSAALRSEWMRALQGCGAKMR